MPRYIPIPYTSSARAAAFWEAVDQSAGADGCWPWSGGRDGNGYGRTKLSYGIVIRTHRLAFFLAHGKDPSDLMVCHRCDNPPCCNPAHLFLGTNSDNQLDASTKGRRVGHDTKGEKNGNAKLSDEDVEKVRAMIRGGATNVAIGRVFGVSHQMISRIRRGRSWGGEAVTRPYRRSAIG